MSQLKYYSLRFTKVQTAHPKEMFLPLCRFNSLSYFYKLKANVS